jgi:ribonucleoside-diphosphate reductase beta chain
VAIDEAAQQELIALEERARPFQALYDHWERTQWGIHQLDFSTDAASFGELTQERQDAMLWIFAHRFHAEFSVARHLTPFLDAAPDLDVRILIATQIADEHKHLQAVLRIYREVFGVEGGLDGVQEVADAHMDPVAEMLYEAFDRRIERLREDRGERCYSQAVFSYHLIAEGVVARTAQNLAGNQYEQLGEFPGLIRGQQLVARDEARHIGIGVSYLRRRMADDREETVDAINEILDQFAELAVRGLELGKAGLEDVLADGYGVDSDAFHDEAMRLLQIRLRSIGYLP